MFFEERAFLVWVLLLPSLMLTIARASNKVAASYAHATDKVAASYAGATQFEIASHTI